MGRPKVIFMHEVGDIVRVVRNRTAFSRDCLGKTAKIVSIADDPTVVRILFLTGFGTAFGEYHVGGMYPRGLSAYAEDLDPL